MGLYRGSSPQPGVCRAILVFGYLSLYIFPIMKLFKCVFTDKDVFSDAYKFELVDDCYYIVTGKLVIESNEIDDSLIGGNKSEEAVPVSSKKDFKEQIKKYCGKLMNRVKEN